MYIINSVMNMCIVINLFVWVPQQFEMSYLSCSSVASHAACYDTFVTSQWLMKF